VQHDGPERKKLDFNCRSSFNEEWNSASVASDWGYSAAYGTDEDGLIVDL